MSGVGVFCMISLFNRSMSFSRQGCATARPDFFFVLDFFFDPAPAVFFAVFLLFLLGEDF
jgi:hypothetical protein